MPAPRLARLLLIFACLALLGGCTLLRFGYGQLDTWALWTADEYFDLDAQQEQAFRARFARLHAWHRRDQLPDYAAFLGEIRARVQKGITREDALWMNEGGRARYRTLVLRGSEDAAALLLTITPPQLDALQRKWDGDNRRFMREHRLDRGIEEQRQEAVRRALARVREWTGALDADQEDKVAALARELPLNAKLRHEDRLRRQQEFLQLMEQRGDPARFTARLRHWLANWEEGRSPEAARAFAEWPRRQADFYVAVNRLLTPQQRASVERRLQNYADDFTRLAQQQPAATASR